MQAEGAWHAHLERESQLCRCQACLPRLAQLFDGRAALLPFPGPLTAKYIFEHPAGWKSETINKRDKGTQGVDCRVRPAGT